MRADDDHLEAEPYLRQKIEMGDNGNSKDGDGSLDAAQTQVISVPF